MHLRGKRAIVTGGTGQLGSRIVDRFVREGMTVAATTTSDRHLQAAARQQSEVFYVKVNVFKEEEVTEFFSMVKDKFGGIDVVVHTVGGFLPAKSLTGVSKEEWDGLMELNLTSTFLCTREALRAMKGMRYGRIINFSAMVGLQPVPGRAPYAISKAGVSLLTEIVARETKGSGITINAIAPSIIDTEANRTSMPEEDHGKWVTPEQIADMICFLCSDSGGSISGTTLKAYGGL